MPPDSDLPAPSEPTALPELPHRFRPLGVRLAATIFALLLVATCVVIGVSFDSDIRRTFSASQIVTMLVMLLAILAALHALGRSRVDATAEGLTVVNGYRTHQVAWNDVVLVALRPGMPWVVLDLVSRDGSDGVEAEGVDTLSAMGIQGSDGTRAQRQVATLRGLVERHSG